MKPTITKIGTHKVKGHMIDHDHQHFDSVFELTEWMTNGGGVEPWKRNGTMAFENNSKDSVTGSTRDSWTGGLTFDDAIEAGMMGWPEGREKMMKTVEAITESLPKAGDSGRTAGFDYEYMEDGDELCIDSYLEGDDRYWLQPQFSAEKPIVRIFINIGASGGVGGETLISRGVVLGAMIVKLERLGYGVQLFVGDAGTSANQRFAATIRIKESDEYLNYDVLAFWVAHPAALRRLMFRIIEAADASVANVGYGYGMPAPITSPDFDFVSDEAHLDRAKKEGWLNNPEKAAAAAHEMISSIVDKQEAVC